MRGEHGGRGVRREAAVLVQEEDDEADVAICAVR